MARTTSRFFVIWEAAELDLRDASWPAHPVTGQKPDVDLAISTNFMGEAIVLPGRAPTNRPTSQWRVSGPAGQDESFGLLVGVTTRVPGTTATEARARLWALCDVVQETFRSLTSGLPAGDHLQALAIPTMRWIVSEFTPAVYAIPEGFAGDCSLEVTFDHRI